MKLIGLKVSVTFLLLLLQVSVVFAQSNSAAPDLTVEELAFIKQHPVVKASNEMEWAPLDFVRDGQARGFSVDYLNLVAEKVGLKVEYVNGYAWDILLGKLENREIDIAQSIIQTPDRNTYLNFTKPYLDLPMVYFGRENSDRINSIEDLNGKRVGVVESSVPADIYEKSYPHLDLVSFNSTIQALKSLSAGSIDVHADILPVSLYMINTNMLPGIEVVGDKFFPETKNADYIRLAARNDWPLMLSILEKGMDAVTEAEFRDLTTKWQTKQTNAVSKNIGLTSEERTWLKENKVLTVAVDPEEAPLEFIDVNGNISGITGAYLQKIGELLNVQFVSAGSVNWADSLSKVKGNDADLVSLVTETEERLRFLSFTEPYVEVIHMIFAREGEEVFGNMDGLVGRKVAQVEGFSVMSFIERDYPDIEIVTADTVANALRLVATGEVDAYVGSMPMATYYIANEGFSNLRVVGDTPYRGENGFGIRKDLVHLASAMQKALSNITPIERAEISRTWLGLQTVEQTIDYSLIWQIALALTAFVGAILFWNYSLRREVGRRIVVERKLLISQERAKSAQAEAEAANAAKSNFLANMSHEIRTPLNAIIGFSEAMLAGIGGQVKEPKHKEYLTDIKDSGEHLATVIKDILDLSKIEAGKWRLEESEFLLAPCLNDAVKMVETHANQKNTKINLDDEATSSSQRIYGDIHAIKRIFINLLSNSIKYTPEGGVIDCKIHRQRNGRVEVEIKDNGIGIPQDRLEHVLNPFEQSHEEYDLNEEGTGLGLPIVKHLTELHGGKFTLSSEIDVATTAKVSFPSRRVVG